MSDYGIAVSQPGYDVKTATDQQLVFTSKYRTFTIFAAGSGSVTIQNNSPTWTPVQLDITHNLGYRPAAIFYTELGSAFRTIIGMVAGQYANVPFTWPIGGDGSIIPWVTTTNLSVRYGGQQGTAGVSETINYKYYIYYEQAI